MTRTECSACPTSSSHVSSMARHNTEKHDGKATLIEVGKGGRKALTEFTSDR